MNLEPFRFIRIRIPQIMADPDYETELFVAQERELI